MARQKNDVERINAYIPIKTMDALRALAKRRGTTYSELLRTAAREYAVREVKVEKEANDAE